MDDTKLCPAGNDHENMPFVYCPCGWLPDPEPSPPTVYDRFCEEVDAFTIKADESAVSVVGRLTGAVRRAQMTVDGDLRPVAERTAEQKANY